MPYYEVYYNKLVDCILQIPEEHVDKFLEKVKEISDSAWETLLDPDYMVDSDYSYDPYSNAQFSLRAIASGFAEINMIMK